MWRWGEKIPKIEWQIVQFHHIANVSVLHKLYGLMKMASEDKADHESNWLSHFIRTAWKTKSHLTMWHIWCADEPGCKTNHWMLTETTLPDKNPLNDEQWAWLCSDLRVSVARCSSLPRSEQTSLHTALTCRFIVFFFSLSEMSGEGPSGNNLKSINSSPLKCRGFKREVWVFRTAVMELLSMLRDLAAGSFWKRARVEDDNLLKSNDCFSTSLLHD